MRIAPQNMGQLWMTVVDFTFRPDGLNSFPILSTLIPLYFTSHSVCYRLWTWTWLWYKNPVLLCNEFRLDVSTGAVSSLARIVRQLFSLR